jgi:type IV pilus assembly protein PilV
MRQHGFTLLEVLVAMVIVSIGLVGLAGLMMTSAKNNQSAYYRSQASWLAYDIVDRMRANRSVAQNTTNYNIAFQASPSGSGMSFTDLTQWKQELVTALPGGDGEITFPGGVATVKVRWDDSRGLGPSTNANNAGNSAQIITIQTQL